MMPYFVYGLASCVPALAVLLAIRKDRPCDSCKYLQLKDAGIGYYKYIGFAECPLKKFDKPPKYCGHYKPREEKQQ